MDKQYCKYLEGLKLEEVVEEYKRLLKLHDDAKAKLDSYYAIAQEIARLRGNVKMHRRKLWMLNRIIKSKTKE